MFSFKDACEWSIGLAVTLNNMQTNASVTYFQLLCIKCQEISSWHLKVKCHEHDIFTLKQPIKSSILSEITRILLEECPFVHTKEVLVVIEVAEIGLTADDNDWDVRAVP